MNPLDHALLAAHETGDQDALISGYASAADLQSELDATCFFLTQAYVFALEAGDPRAERLGQRLQDYGRL